MTQTTSEARYLFDTAALIDIYHGRRRVQPYFDRLFEGSSTAYVSPLSEAVSTSGNFVRKSSG